MENEIMFSICIPVYNKKHYLRRCIESIRDQTNNNYEILFADDCSTDGSREMLESLSEHTNKVRLIKNVENQGLSNNRNILIENALGKYILFLDPDDTINSELLERLIEHTKDNIDMIRYQIDLKNDKDGKDVERFNFKRTDQVLTGEEAIKYFSKYPKKRYALACSFCIRRQFLKENMIQYPKELRLHEDIATLPIMIANAKSVSIIDYRGYNYYRNKDSLTRSIDEEKDLFKYINIVFNNQKRFMTAIEIAKDGVVKSPISEDAKKEFISDMLSRVNLYNDNVIKKIEENINVSYTYGD